jgi:hypothetical protein
MKTWIALAILIETVLAFGPRANADSGCTYLNSVAAESTCADLAADSGYDSYSFDGSDCYGCWPN